MNATSKGIVFAAAGLALALPIVCARAQTASAGPAQQTPTGPEAKKAEQVYKNIQVLKGIPADQVFPAMLFITASLGVQCDYFHVERAFEKDDKPPKQTARKMMQMMFAINKDNFGGHREVTCYSCHRGATDPAGTPIIAEEEPRPGPGGPMRPEGASPAANTPAGPSADQLIEKYVEALGGADALQKISSRVEKGTMTPFAGPPRFLIDVLSKAPDKRMSVVHLPGGGDSVTAYDGHVGWMGGNPGMPPREMSGGDLEGVKLDADFYFPVHIKQVFSQLRVRPPDKVGDHEANVVFGVNPGQPPVKLYFDEQSGLLVRLVRYEETPLGRNPTQIDYADYRDSGGVKAPFRWTIARPRGRSTIQIDQIEQNVAIDDAKFAKPASPAATGQNRPPSP
jgi:photosynthetic reaction center cytochrome c subunit